MHPPSPSFGQQLANASLPELASFVSAVGVVVIGIIAAGIAFRQFQTARNKLKLDLYDKRVIVYDVVRKTLGAATSRGKLSQAEEIEYLSGIQTAKWLFGRDVHNYLEKILWGKIVDFGLHNAMLTAPSSDERTRHIHQRAETMNWLIAQYREFDKLCAPYLRLRH